MTELQAKHGPLSLILLTVTFALAVCHPMHQAYSSPPAPPSPHASHYACPDGWADHQDVCLWVSDSEATQSDATSACNAKEGYLANIMTVSQNQIIAGLISSISTPVWIGLKRDNYYRRYTNDFYTWRGAGETRTVLTLALWNNSPSASQAVYRDLCVAMKADGMWYGDLDCGLNYRFVCERKPDCARGWTGTNCSEVCHCASFVCGSSYSTCPYGCQPGWTGSKCDQEIEKPEVVYYCENATDTGPQLVLRVGVKGVNYQDFRSLDEEGMVESNCSKSDFLQTSNPAAFSITVPVPSSPICHGHLVTNTTSTYQWTFGLAEFPDVLSQRDFVFTFTCDFSEADSRRRTAYFWQETPPSSEAENVTQTHEEVKLLVVDPDTTSGLQPLGSAVIGTRVRLAMTFALHPGVRAKGISPRECMVSSSDGLEECSITDTKGCASSGSPISKLTGNGTLQQTEVFSIFSFRQSQYLYFTCSFDYCFSDGDTNCQDRCSASSNSGLGKKHRGKRSAPGTSNNLVSAFVKVLPGEPPQEDPAEENTASLVAAPGLVVGVAVVAALVGVLLSVVTVRARSALCGARRHEWTALPQSPEPF